jgi:positive regulator of sigma E activity
MSGLTSEVNLPAEGEVGLVVETGFGTAELQVQEKAACKGCSARSCCSLIGEGTRIVTANDPIGVSRGQRVMFYVLPTNVLKASILAFFVPLCGMIIGGLVGYRLGSGMEDPNAAGALGVICALLSAALSFVVIRLVDRRYGITRSYLPVIASVVSDRAEDKRESEEEKPS